MKKPKPIAVKGYPICSNCHPENDFVFDPDELTEGIVGNGIKISCKKCGRIVFIYK